MSSPDYELHVSLDRMNAIWDRVDEEPEAFPFGEDMDLIDKMIEEEIGTPRRKKRNKSSFQ